MFKASCSNLKACLKALVAANKKKKNLEHAALFKVLCSAASVRTRIIGITTFYYLPIPIFVS
jgi:hypothetical protein